LITTKAPENLKDEKGGKISNPLEKNWNGIQPHVKYKTSVWIILKLIRNTCVDANTT
jgi:hypothetical protein